MPRYDLDEDIIASAIAEGYVIVSSIEELVERKEKNNKMKNLQVRDLKNYISVQSSIRFIWNNTGESFVPKVGDFDRYGDLYVTEFFCSSNELNLSIQGEI